MGEQSGGNGDTPGRGQDWAAIVFVVYVAACFAMVSVCAKIAFQGGSNALSALVIRSVLTLAALIVFFAWRKVPMALPPRQRYAAWILGIIFCGNNLGMFAALETLPAPLAVLIFYTAPIMVALVEWAMGHRKMTAFSVVALLLAFCGLGLALNAGQHAINLAGAAWATFSAVCFTAVLVLSGRLFPSGDSRPRTLHMIAAASVLFVLGSTVSAGFAWPNTSLAWLGIAGVSLFYALAVTGMFAAVARVGAGRTAQILNVEPVLVVVLSYLILKDAITLTQLAGIALVLASVWALERNQPAPAPAVAAAARD